MKKMARMTPPTVKRPMTVGLLAKKLCRWEGRG
jgi:hypothetical protein